MDPYDCHPTKCSNFSQVDSERIEKALAYAREMLTLYKSIPTGSIGAAFIQRDIEAVENGDHSEVAIRRLEDISS